MVVRVWEEVKGHDQKGASGESSWVMVELCCILAARDDLHGSVRACVLTYNKIIHKLFQKLRVWAGEIV